MSIIEFIKSAGRKNTKIEMLEYELILAHILNKPREWILSHPRHKLTQKQITKLNLLLRRKAKGEPLAYILGHKEFYGFDFLVNKNTLIPRPETEAIVDEIRALPLDKQYIIIDAGTGSGCLIISLVKVLSRGSGVLPSPGNQKTYINGRQVMNSRFLATDISRKALSTAKKNARRLGTENIKFFPGNLLDPIIKKGLLKTDKGNRDLVIAANLPYLTPAQIKKSASISYEPRQALDGGQDGLKYYRKLFKQIKTFLSSSGQAKLAPASGAFAPEFSPSLDNYHFSKIYLFCEIDPSQKFKLVRLVKHFFPESLLKIKKDLRGHSRLAVVTIN